MLVLIIENEEDTKEALKLDWEYANQITKTPYVEVTEALDRFS
jgi:hypothetical protein